MGAKGAEIVTRSTNIMERRCFLVVSFLLFLIGWRLLVYAVLLDEWKTIHPLLQSAMLKMEQKAHGRE
jgi:hypothetical protein